VCWCGGGCIELSISIVQEKKLIEKEKIRVLSPGKPKQMRNILQHVEKPRKNGRSCLH
jgi:hypothetical protein